MKENQNFGQSLRLGSLVSGRLSASSQILECQTASTNLLPERYCSHPTSIHIFRRHECMHLPELEVIAARRGFRRQSWALPESRLLAFCVLLLEPSGLKHPTPRRQWIAWQQLSSNSSKIPQTIVHECRISHIIPCERFHGNLLQHIIVSDRCTLPLP